MDDQHITLYGYQTGSTTTSTFTDVRVQIWNGAPNAGGVLVYGDTTTNRFASTSFTNDYRVTDTTLTNNQRPIMAMVATINTTLPAGTYWVDFQLGGTLASGPFVPPVSILGQTAKAGSNGLQWNGTAWTTLLDTGTAQAVQDHLSRSLESRGRVRNTFTDGYGDATYNDGNTDGNTSGWLRRELRRRDGTGTAGGLDNSCNGYRVALGNVNDNTRHGT